MASMERIERAVKALPLAIGINYTASLSFDADLQTDVTSAPDNATAARKRNSGKSYCSLYRRHCDVLQVPSESRAMLNALPGCFVSSASNTTDLRRRVDATLQGSGWTIERAFGVDACADGRDWVDGRPGKQEAQHRDTGQYWQCSYGSQAVPAHLLEEHYRYLASKRRALWLAPVGVVARYLEVQKNVEISAVAVASINKRDHHARGIIFLRTVLGRDLPDNPGLVSIAVGPFPKSWTLEEAYAGPTGEKLRVRQSAEWEWWDGASSFEFVTDPVPRPKDERHDHSRTFGDRVARGRDLYAVVDVRPPRQGSLMISMYFQRVAIHKSVTQGVDPNQHFTVRHDKLARERVMRIAHSNGPEGRTSYLLP